MSKVIQRRNQTTRSPSPDRLWTGDGANGRHGLTANEVRSRLPESRQPGEDDFLRALEGIPFNQLAEQARIAGRR